MSLVFESLEQRLVLSSIVWTTRGGPVVGDTDNFTATFGANDQLARSIVDRAIDDWERVIQNFNYQAFGGGGEPIADNTYTLDINAADLGGGSRGVTNNVNSDAQGKPYDADITMDDDGGGAGWFLDPTPWDDQEFTTLLSSFTANGPNALGGNDFYRTIVHEIGHAMGIASSTALAIHNFLTAYGTDAVDGASTLSLFQGASITASLTDDGGLHIYEGPAVGGNPTHPNDLMNAGRTVGFPPPTRQLITDTNALILADAYGYTINLPSQLNTFHANLNATTGVLTVNGAPDTFDDQIVIDNNGSLRVIVNGTEETFLGQNITQIDILSGAGDDFIFVSADVGIPVSVDAGTGDDEFHSGGGPTTIVQDSDDGNDLYNLSNLLQPITLTYFGDQGSDQFIGSEFNDVLNVDTSSGLLAGTVSFDGRGGFDRINVLGDGSFTNEAVNIGATAGSGRHTLDGQSLDFENIEPFTTNVAATNFDITSTPGLASLLQDDNQINYSAGQLTSVNWGRVTVDNFEPIEFLNKTNLTIDAGAGSDTINLNYQNPAQSAPGGLTGTITVNGQDPTGSDQLILNTRATVLDDLILAPLAQGAGSVESSGGLPTTEFTGVEHLTVVMQPNEQDSFAIDGTSGNDQWSFAPGATSDTGTFTGTMDLTGSLAAGPFPLVPTTFAGVDIAARTVILNGDFTLAGESGGNDSLIFHGTAGNDTIRVYDSAGADVGVQNTINGSLFSNIDFYSDGGETVIVRGLDGDDLFLHDNTNGIDDVVHYEGGSPGSGSDVLQLLGDTSAAAVENVTIRPDAAIPTNQQIVGLGSPIGVSGVELIAYLGAPDGAAPPVPNDSLTVELGDGDNWARVERGSDVAGTAADLLTSDSLPDLQFATLDTLTIDGGGGEDQITFQTWLLAGVENYIIDGGTEVDTLTVEGTSGPDLIDVFQPAASSLAADNYTLSIAVGATLKVVEITKTMAATAPDTPGNLPTVEELRILAGNGSDTIRVGHADAYTDLNAAANVPDQRVRITVDGGEPNASDRLVVRDDGDGDLVLVRQANDERSGRVTVAPAATLFSATQAGAGDVAYQGIERLDIVPVDPVSGGSGADGGGRVVVFQTDPFELNDNRLISTEFSDLTRIHRNPTIDPGAGAFDLPGDEDWYEFRAPKIGTFRFDVYFDRLTTTTNGRPGLPGNGDLGIAVYNSAGQVIVHGQADTLSANAEVTASATFSAAQDQVYFLRVRGGSEARDNDAAINTYFASLTEVDLLGPQVFDPDGAGPEQAIQIVTAGVVNENFNLFEVKPDGVDQGPTPLIDGLLINVRDLLTRELERRAPGDPLSDIYPALDQIVAETIGNYQVVGDHVGIIAIESVVVNNDIPDDRRAISATVTAQNNLSSFTAAGLIGSEVVAGDVVVFESTSDLDLAGQVRVISAFDPATGQITVADPFLDMPVAGDTLTVLRIATATITLNFVEPLPDDRFTLVIDDSVTDPPGNLFDGESNAGQPIDSPTFPSGDGVSGGDFVARFTVDSRAEIGIWAAGSVWIDTNGNFFADPENADDTNEDITYVLGFPTDNVFAGNFVGDPLAMADGFDKLAAYGRVAGQFRWLIDTDNDGVPNLIQPNSPSVNGLPFAGNFDGNAANGDEVGLFGGGIWYLDTTHDFQTNTQLLGSNMTGYPFAGDFDDDGIDDLGTFADDRFQLDLSSVGGITGQWDREIRFGFTGVLERPFAADFDGDTIDDLGLWVPNGRGTTPEELSEWYIFVSDERAIDARLRPNPEIGGAGTIIDFVPIPFGADIYAEFGNAYALPVVGNFDPPVVPIDSSNLTTLRFTNLDNPTDINRDGRTTPVDALHLINYLNVHGNETLPRITVESHTTLDGPLLDATADWVLSPADVLRVVNRLNQLAGGEGEAAGQQSLGELSGGSTPGVLPADAGAVAASFSLADPDQAAAAQADVRTQQIESAVVAGASQLLAPTEATSRSAAVGQLWEDQSLENVLDELAADVYEAWING
ncbi:MAG: hypothetical protein J5I93_11420 [Pirellulaceae bacterium]|nr:hypothetical protein [Pirellulaceae bacterium]